MRTFNVKHLAEGTWLKMFDHHGQQLRGITGAAGVRALALTASYIGADFISIKPGCGFDLHAHPGDHILYIIAGSGIVHFDGDDVNVAMGSVMHIPAEYPHAVRVPREATMPMVLLAVGHPHCTIDAIDRSYAASESHDFRDKTLPARVRAGTDSRR